MRGIKNNYADKQYSTDWMAKLGNLPEELQHTIFQSTLLPEGREINRRLYERLRTPYQQYLLDAPMSKQEIIDYFETSGQKHIGIVIPWIDYEGFQRNDYGIFRRKNEILFNYIFNMAVGVKQQHDDPYMYVELTFYPDLHDYETPSIDIIAETHDEDIIDLRTKYEILIRRQAKQNNPDFNAVYDKIMTEFNATLARYSDIWNIGNLYAYLLINIITIDALNIAPNYNYFLQLSERELDDEEEMDFLDIADRARTQLRDVWPVGHKSSKEIQDFLNIKSPSILKKIDIWQDEIRQYFADRITSV
jgi:hypothetical protein